MAFALEEEVEEPVEEAVEEVAAVEEAEHLQDLEKGEEALQ